MEAGDEPEPIVLLPGEATGIWALNREDLPRSARTPEVLKKVERWQETLFLYGRIQYMELGCDRRDAHARDVLVLPLHSRRKEQRPDDGRPAGYNKHS